MFSLKIKPFSIEVCTTVFPYDEWMDNVAFLPRHKRLRVVDVQSLGPLSVLEREKETKQTKKTPIGLVSNLKKC